MESNGGFDEIWNLMCQLRTNPLIYARLLTLEGIHDLVEAVSNKSYRLLYSLQIMENFMNEYQVKKEDCLIKSYY